MIARRTPSLAVAVLAVVTVGAATAGCSGNSATPAPQEKQFELGARRVQVIVPTGWEALDQGKQKRFRKGEFEIVLQDLGHRAQPSTGAASSERASAMDDLVDWGLAEVGHNERRDEKSRRTLTIDGREAIDIETWNRLDHTNPQRVLFVRDDGDLLALHTVRMALDDSLAAFDAIRDSLHFVSERR